MWLSGNVEVIVQFVIQGYNVAVIHYSHVYVRLQRPLCGSVHSTDVLLPVTHRLLTS